MPIAIVSVLAVLVVAGTVSVLVLSTRLRREIVELLAGFDRAERRLAPLVATVRADRERLAARLQRLTDAGTEPDRR
jgi:hypothetical protein